MAPTSSFDICIQGAGIVGRTLALHLAAQRLRVALVAQPSGTTAGHGDVRAYALSASSRDTLQAVRCWPSEAHATPVLAMDIWGDARTHVRFEAFAQGVEALNWIVDVPALEAQLAQAVQFQSFIEVCEQPPESAALTVVCEGRHSSTRAELGVEFDTLPYGQSALAARVRCMQAHEQVARQWFHEDGDIVALLPLEGPAGHECALVWSTLPAQAQRLCELSPEAFADALAEKCQHPQGSLHLISERSVWPLQAARAQRWCGVRASERGGAWVLAGDAAHNVHPLAGQGLNLGLGDVQCLARVLQYRPFWRGVDDQRLLRQYERERKAEYAVLGGSGDLLQRLFTTRHPAVRSLRLLGMQWFEHSGPVKNWVAQRAMGAQSLAPIARAVRSRAALLAPPR